jgi:hypothetical protein
LFAIPLRCDTFAIPLRCDTFAIPLRCKLHCKYMYMAFWRFGLR